jgi:DNA repair photolyase
MLPQIGSYLTGKIQLIKIGITERGDAALDFDKWKSKAKEVDGLILLTKDPALLLKRLHKSSVPKDKCIVHCTITGWAGSVFEPNVPSVERSIAAYQKFSDLLGPERVVLRIDPIIPTVDGSLRAHNVLRQQADDSARIRISFLDLYKHVRYNLKHHADEYVKEIYGIYGEELHAPLDLRLHLLSNFPDSVEICGEPGMPCTGCVSHRDLAALGLASDSDAKSNQRRLCQCLAVKTELLDRKHPCAHGCLYCYWR